MQVDMSGNLCSFPKEKYSYSSKIVCMDIYIERDREYIRTHISYI